MRQSRLGRMLLTAVVLSGLFGAGLVGGWIGVASAHDEDTLWSRSLTHVVPYYNKGAGKSSFLIIHCPGGNNGGDCEDLSLQFFDQTCARVANAQIELTEIDTEVFDLGLDFPEIPAEGAFTIESLDGEEEVMVLFVNVDVTAGTAYVLPAINSSTDNDDLGMYDTQAILPLGLTDDGVTATVFVTLSCPRGNPTATVNAHVGENMGAWIFNNLPGGNTHFEAARGILDMFIFDTDEGFIQSKHSVACRCFERKRLKDWALSAATQDVVVYWQEHATTQAPAQPTGGQSIAGIQETTVVSGGEKFFTASYLYHRQDYFEEEPEGQAGEAKAAFGLRMRSLMPR